MAEGGEGACLGANDWGTGSGNRLPGELGPGASPADDRRLGVGWRRAARLRGTRSERGGSGAAVLPSPGRAAPRLPPALRTAAALCSCRGKFAARRPAGQSWRWVCLFFPFFLPFFRSLSGRRFPLPSRQLAPHGEETAREARTEERGGGPWPGAASAPGSPRRLCRRCVCVRGPG